VYYGSVKVCFIVLYVTHNVISSKKIISISEDNTTCYGREQKEKGKLQITEELYNGLRQWFPNFFGSRRP
jgi:hypothetical protein